MIISNLSYENITKISQTPLFIILGILFIFIPIFFTIITASLIHAKDGNGKVYKKRMVSSPGLWLAIGLFILIQSLLLLFGFYFPFWANIL